MFWVRGMIIVMVMTFLPMGVKNYVYPEAVMAEGGIASLCNYRVSQNGNIHGFTSMYYNQVNYRTDLCLKEAQVIASALNPAR